MFLRNVSTMLHREISRISFSCLTVPPLQTAQCVVAVRYCNNSTIYCRAVPVCPTLRVPYDAHSHPLLGLYNVHAVLYVRYKLS